MRAVTVNKANGPDAITVEDRTVREPHPGEVRLRVAAAAVNPIDVFMWRRAVEPPFTPGMDAAGTIESVGHAGGRLSVGESVMAVVGPWLPEGGAQAELVVVPAACVVPMPRGVSAPQAATLPMNGLTALEGLRMLDLAAGSTLAVTGGAGLLASYVIALARQRGIRVIADAGPGDEAHPGRVLHRVRPDRARHRRAPAADAGHAVGDGPQRDRGRGGTSLRRSTGRDGPCRRALRAGLPARPGREPDPRCRAWRHPRPGARRGARAARRARRPEAGGRGARGGVRRGRSPGRQPLHAQPARLQLGPAGAAAASCRAGRGRGAGGGA